MKLLHLDSSILGRGSVTRELSRRIVERLVAEAPDASVTYRDLAADPLPHVTPVSIPSPHRVAAAADTLDEAGAADRATSDRVLAEFLDADTVVIGAPMYNFTLPSQLKAWIDRILIPGTTFRYGPGGVEGLAAGKRVVVGIARGGFYGPETGFASAEHAEAYLRSAFGFIGIEPEFVVAEGLSRGEDARADILASAQDAIGQLAA